MRPLVPERIDIDTFEGNAYVSLVAFTMQKIRPRNLPAIKFISDFDEINLRTYVESDNKKGVYFLNIEAGKELSAFIARKLSGLPYGKSKIRRTETLYESINHQKRFDLNIEYKVQETLTDKTALDHWLTERYCLYVDQANDVFRYDIHHEEWKINPVNFDRLQVNYRVGNLFLTNQPDLTHYSEGVKVLAWKRLKI